jgi:hypothetical protein
MEQEIGLGYKLLRKVCRHPFPSPPKIIEKLSKTKQYSLGWPQEEIFDRIVFLD